MLKSVCIKTNNKNIVSCLLENVEHLNLNDTLFSHYRFKMYDNIIIHYLGNDLALFLVRLSYLLTDIIISYYEPIIFKKLILSNYFYFSSLEQKQILDLCVSNSDDDNELQKNEIISCSVFEYLLENKCLNLDGFMMFRVPEYINFLDSIVDLCVNKFVIDREYVEFINLLKIYINSKNSCSNIIHLVYKNHDSILLDENHKIIKCDTSFFKNKYLSDVSFSSNDFALNSLLTLLPATLYVHLIDEQDEFINTLKLIFDDRINICNDCDICKIYNSNFEITKI